MTGTNGERSFAKTVSRQNALSEWNWESDNSVLRGKPYDVAAKKNYRRRFDSFAPQRKD